MLTSSTMIQVTTSIHDIVSGGYHDGLSALANFAFLVLVYGRIIRYIHLKLVKIFSFTLYKQ